MIDYNEVKITITQYALISFIRDNPNILHLDIEEKGLKSGISIRTFNNHKKYLVSNNIIHEQSIGGTRENGRFELNDEEINPVRGTSKSSSSIVYNLHFDYIKWIKDNNKFIYKNNGKMELIIDGDIIIHMPGHTYEYEKKREYRTDNGKKIRPGRMREEFKKNIEGKDDKEKKHEFIKAVKGTKDKIKKGEKISNEDFGGVVNNIKPQDIKSVNDIII